MSLPHATIDQAFLRFQETGNPEHLAKVFDGTSAQLLQMAQHLVPDASVGEDLLQATFLIAIERRHNYKPSGHVLSWLFGILVHQARDWHRTMGRKIGGATHLGDDAVGLVDQGLEEPHETLEKKELSGAVMEAIARIPDPYKPV